MSEFVLLLMCLYTLASSYGQSNDYQEYQDLIAHIKEALENNCGKCTDAQKNGTRKVIGHLINKEKEYWDKLCAKYDPQRKYVSVYEKELREVAA